jgi:hypothetical protein
MHEDRYDALSKTVNEINLSQREQTVLLKGIKETVDRLNQVVIVGNGQKPLLTRVDIIEKTISHNSERIEKIADQVDSVDIEKAKIKRNSILIACGVSVLAAVFIYDALNNTNIATWVLKLIKVV